MRVTGRPVGRGNPAPETLVLGEKTAWTAKGKCVGEDPEKWFAEEGSSDYSEAKALCKACPVQLNCAKYARETGQVFGIWGGENGSDLNDPQRGARRIRRIAARKEEWSGTGA